MSHSDSATMEDIDGLNGRVDELERKFKEAFPSGDYAGHCRYHEVQIQILLDRRALTAAVREKTISGLVWALMIVLGLAFWQWLKAQVAR